MPCLASFPFRSCCREGELKHYLLLALQSHWKMLLPFKKRMVQLPMQDQAFGEGKCLFCIAGTCVCGYSPSSVLVSRTVIVLCRLPSCFTAFGSAPALPPLSEGTQVAEGIQVSPKITQACSAPAVSVMRSWLRLPSTSWCREAF